MSAACRSLSIVPRPANSSPATISSSGSARFVKHLVNYAAVSDLKMPVLELLFQSARVAQGQRWDAFLLFQREMDEALARQATFDALHEHFFKGQGKWMWQEWPGAFRDPEGEAVARFRDENAERIEFFQVAAMAGR